MLMNDQRQLRKEIKARNCALFDLTIDEAMVEFRVIELIENELKQIESEISTHADLGFLGHSHPGGLTKLLYGNANTIPPSHPPRH